MIFTFLLIVKINKAKAQTPLIQVRIMRLLYVYLRLRAKSDVRTHNGVQILMSEVLKDDGGATAIEYGLIAALIAVVIIATVTTLGTQLDSTFQTISDGMGSGGAS